MFVDPSHGILKAGAGPLASGEHHVPAMLFTLKREKSRERCWKERKTKRNCASDQCHAVN